MISKEFLALLFILARGAAALRQCKTIPAYMQLLHQDDFFNPPVPTPGTKTVNGKLFFCVSHANGATAASDDGELREKLEFEEEFGVQREVWGFRNATRKPRFPWEKKKTVRYSFELGATSELFIYDENGDSPTAHHASWVKREEEESLVSMFAAPLNYSAVDVCWEYTFHHARIVREFVDLRFREVSQTCRNQKWTVIRSKVTLQLQPTDLFSSQRWCTQVHPLAPNTTYEFSMKYHGRGI